MSEHICKTFVEKDGTIRLVSTILKAGGTFETITLRDDPAEGFVAEGEPHRTTDPEESYREHIRLVREWSGPNGKRLCVTRDGRVGIFEGEEMIGELPNVAAVGEILSQLKACKPPKGEYLN